ncbi:related to transporter (major facilitator superfamily) [Phialocephala subalpina]|uniref:Related to transporter (Major facilitator superfamily) n=1 Tax=Phialocephala subalpina TaxID=576137 RepID=A0A1L7XJL5_9HELO|nr:related to transporter (major facilitator superfamily) [Phialocephala subalpina]
MAGLTTAETKEASAETVKNIDSGIQLNIEDNFEAKEATDAEHAMTLRQAIKRYPKAIVWSILLSTAIAMEGYDLVLISSFYAFPTFTEKYGVSKNGGKAYQIPAPWQAGLSNGARVGEILGLFLNGIISERYGFKKTMIGTLILLLALIFIPFFAQNIETLEVAEILMGVPWGVFQTLTTAYAAEVYPVTLRAYLTTYVNMMWGLGQLIAAGVLRAFLHRADEWSYRIPFALQWMWPWLVRRGRAEEARIALRRLTSDASSSELDKTISMIQHTNELEKEVSSGTSYLDCVRGVNLRRTEITCLTWVIQAASGASMMGYSAYFFGQAGLPTSIAFDFSISLYAVAMIGVMLSWFAMTYFGRRAIYLSGLSTMFLVLMTIGFISLAPSSNHAASFATGSLLLLFTLCYDITIGSVAYSIVAEIPSTRLRTKTIVLARNLYNVQGIVNGISTPYMLNPDAWGWRGKAGFFWAGTAGICLLWSYFRLPEPKGRTYGELDLLFEQGVTARKFKEASVDVFVDSAEMVVGGEKRN